MSLWTVSLECVDTVLYYEEQWDFNYTDIVALFNIHACINYCTCTRENDKDNTDYCDQLQVFNQSTFISSSRQLRNVHINMLQSDLHQEIKWEEVAHYGQTIFIFTLRLAHSNSKLGSYVFKSLWQKYSKINFNGGQITYKSDKPHTYNQKSLLYFYSVICNRDICTENIELNIWIYIVTHPFMVVNKKFRKEFRFFYKLTNYFLFL